MKLSAILSVAVLAVIGMSNIGRAEQQIIIQNQTIEQEIIEANKILASEAFSRRILIRVPGEGPAIIGLPEATPGQVINYIKSRNPMPSLNCSVEELVHTYYDEAQSEGIRPDVAISQAILETGFFGYGGDVVAEQNNYCGLGTTGNGVKGAWFTTPREGIRAHIQHLLAYSTERLPSKPIVDPRYELVRNIPSIFAKSTTLYSLNGKWAVPGINYGQKIEKILHEMKSWPSE